MDASRLERAARAAAEYVLGEMAGRLAKMGYSGGVCVESNFINSAAAHALRAALAAQPAQEPVDTLCLFCRTELDPDEMDDGSDLPPLAPGVCSECFQRWHDEPVWRKRLKEATDKPAQAGEAVAWCIRDRHGQRGNVHIEEARARAECDYLNRDPSTPYYIGQGPYEVVTLYAAPSRPSGAPGPASAEAVAREAALFALREFCRIQGIPRDYVQTIYIDRAVAHALRAQRPGGAA